MKYWINSSSFIVRLYNYALMLSGLIVTLNLVRFSFISVLTPIAAK